MRIFVPFFLMACGPDPKTFNASPRADVVSHDEGAIFVVGYPQELRVQISDPNHSSDVLKYRFLIDEREICGSWQDGNTLGDVRCTYDPKLGDDELIVEVEDPLEFVEEGRLDITVVESESPMVDLIQPIDQNFYYADQKVFFQGMVSDAEDDLSQISLFWESSIDGVLEISAEPDSLGFVQDTDNLSVGEHTISLTAVDSLGKESAISAFITVVDTNTDPDCTVLSPENLSASAYGQMLSMEGLVSDSESGMERLSVTWSTDKDGVLNTTIPNIDGSTSIGLSTLSLNTHLVSLRVDDDAGGVCIDTLLISITSPPQLIIASPMQSSAYNLGESIDFTAQVSDPEDPANMLKVEWESSVDGVFSIKSPSLSGSVSFPFAQLSSGQHTITARVEDTVGLSTSETRSIVINTPPDQPSISLSPDPLRTGDDITANVSGLNDPDGNFVTARYEWFRDGVLTSETSSIVSESETTRGELWQVWVYPDDGYTEGLPNSATIVVDNTAPIITALNLSQTANVYNDTTLSCSGTIVDPDETAMESYVWQNVTQGMELGVGSSVSLNAAIASPQDVIRCVLEGEDSQGETDSSSVDITLDNRSPSLASVILSPSSPSSSDNVTCLYGASDEDELNPYTDLSISISWTNVTTGDSLGNGDSVSLIPSIVSPGDILQCSILISDGIGSVAASASGTVQNSDPEIMSISVSPSTVYVDDTLVCSVVVNDPDGDASTLSYTWTNLSSNTVVSTTDTVILDSSVAVGGDVLECVAVVEDSSGFSDTDSTAIAVDNSPPSFVGFGIVPNSNVTVEDELVCDGTVFDPDLGTVSYSYVWTNQSTGVEIGLAQSLQLSAGLADPGDQVECTIFAMDSAGEQVEQSSSVLIENSRPVVSGVLFDPLYAYASDSITVLGLASDADGDTLQLTYDWYVDSVLTVINSDTLPSESATRGNTIYVEVVANDGTVDSAVYTSSALTLSNSLPTIDSVSVTPSVPYAGQDDLFCIVNDLHDADGDATSVEITWFVDGVLWGGSTSQTTYPGDTIESSDTNHNELWYCIVQPSDGYDDGLAVESLDVTLGKNCYVTDCDFPAQGIDFVTLDGDVFLMGSPVSEVGREGNESLHVVELTGDFAISTTEINQEQFTALMGYNPSQNTACGDMCPVENVSWDEAVAFANQLSLFEGTDECYSCSGIPPNVSCSEAINPYTCTGYRLPTEAEWEYAARAMQSSAVWTFNGGGEIQTGEALICQSGLDFDDGTPIGNTIYFCGNATETHEVADLTPNTFIMYDMGGNVWEWVHDEYTADLGDQVYTDPVTAGSGSSWVIRGGSYLSHPKEIRAAARSDESAARVDLGFRLAISQ